MDPDGSACVLPVLLVSLCEDPRVGAIAGSSPPPVRPANSSTCAAPLRQSSRLCCREGGGGGVGGGGEGSAPGRSLLLPSALLLLLLLLGLAACLVLLWRALAQGSTSRASRDPNRQPDQRIMEQGEDEEVVEATAFSTTTTSVIPTGSVPTLTPGTPSRPPWGTALSPSLSPSPSPCPSVSAAATAPPAPGKCLCRLFTHEALLCNRMQYCSLISLVRCLRNDCGRQDQAHQLCGRRRATGWKK